MNRYDYIGYKRKVNSNCTQLESRFYWSQLKKQDLIHWIKFITYFIPNAIIQIKEIKGILKNYFIKLN